MSNFDEAVQKTLKNEGGYINNPSDSGGETNMGISKRQYPDLDIKNLTQDQAIEIYQENYWKPLYSQIVDQPVAEKLFDLGVLFGVHTAVKLMQTVLNIVADGIFGPHTLGAINAAEPTSLLEAYKTAFVSHALGIVEAQPKDRIFFSGWVRRINS